MAYKLKINYADFNELTRIPGIGPNAAQSIIEFRQLYGQLYPEDLHSIPYIKISPVLWTMLDFFDEEETYEYPFNYDQEQRYNISEAIDRPSRNGLQNNNLQCPPYPRSPVPVSHQENYLEPEVPQHYATRSDPERYTDTFGTSLDMVKAEPGYIESKNYLPTAPCESPYQLNGQSKATQHNWSDTGGSPRSNLQYNECRNDLSTTPSESPYQLSRPSRATQQNWSATGGSPRSNFQYKEYRNDLATTPRESPYQLSGPSRVTQNNWSATGGSPRSNILKQGTEEMDMIRKDTTKDQKKAAKLSTEAVNAKRARVGRKYLNAILGEKKGPNDSNKLIRRVDPSERVPSIFRIETQVDHFDRVPSIFRFEKVASNIVLNKLNSKDDEKTSALAEDTASKTLFGDHIKTLQQFKQLEITTTSSKRKSEKNKHKTNAQGKTVKALLEIQDQLTQKLDSVQLILQKRETHIIELKTELKSSTKCLTEVQSKSAENEKELSQKVIESRRSLEKKDRKIKNIETEKKQLVNKIRSKEKTISHLLRSTQKQLTYKRESIQKLQSQLRLKTYELKIVKQTMSNCDLKEELTNNKPDCIKSEIESGDVLSMNKSLSILRFDLQENMHTHARFNLGVNEIAPSAKTNDDARDKVLDRSDPKINIKIPPAFPTETSISDHQNKGREKDILDVEEASGKTDEVAITLPDEDASISSDGNASDIADMATADEDVSATVDGDVSATVDGDVSATVDGDVSATVDEDVSATVDEDVSATVDGDVSATVDGDVSATVDGDVSATVDEDVSATVDGDVSATVDGDVSATVDEDVSATVDEDVSATVDGDVSATVDEDVSATVDEDVSATDDGDESATANRKSTASYNTAFASTDDNAPTIADTVELVTSDDYMSATNDAEVPASNDDVALTAADKDVSAIADCVASATSDKEEAPANDDNTPSTTSGEDTSAPSIEDASAGDDDDSPVPDVKESLETLKQALISYTAITSRTVVKETSAIIDNEVSVVADEKDSFADVGSSVTADGETSANTDEKVSGIADNGASVTAVGDASAFTDNRVSASEEGGILTIANEQQMRRTLVCFAKEEKNLNKSVVETSTSVLETPPKQEGTHYGSVRWCMDPCAVHMFNAHGDVTPLGRQQSTENSILQPAECTSCDLIEHGVPSETNVCDDDLLPSDQPPKSIAYLQNGSS